MLAKRPSAASAESPARQACHIHLLEFPLEGNSLRFRRIPLCSFIMSTLRRVFALLLAATACACASAAPWMTDWEAAKAKAKEENKPIFINLTGSDWCGWCIKIEKEVFSHKDFIAFAKEHLILMEADFPRKKTLPEEVKKQNEALKKDYLNGGYLLDPEGKKLSEDIGELKGGVEEYLKVLPELIAKWRASTPADKEKPAEDSAR